MLALILLKQLQSNRNQKNTERLYLHHIGLAAYCIINIGNGATGEFYGSMASYFKTLGLIPYSDLYYSIHLQSLHFIHYFLILWGIMSPHWLPQRILAKEQRFWQYRAKLVIGPTNVPILSIPVSAISHFSLTRVFSVPNMGFILHCFHAYFFLYKEPISQTHTSI